MNKKRLLDIVRYISGAMLLSLAVNACAPASLVTPPSSRSGKLLQSQSQRITDPQSPPEDQAALAAGNSAFALDFFQFIRQQDGNLFFSPYSLSTALAMTYAGARQRTEGQMSDVLHFELPQERLHPVFNALDLQLSQDQPAAGKDDPQPFQLSLANALWGQQDFSFTPEYLDTLARNYGASLRLLDFKSAPEDARQEINDWVYRQTLEKIKDLIPAGGITPDTRLVLANAIYFKADWLYPFKKESTRDQPFTLLDGSLVDTSMMSLDDPKNLPYYAGDGFQAAQLPYVGDTVSMLLLVPDAGRLAEFEAGLSASQVEQILAQLQGVPLQVVLPKFEFTSEYQLKDVLSKMGMPEAFDPDLADFTGMNLEKLLYIGDVFHKAFVAVDEKGTEAAAASAVVMKALSAPMEQSQLLVVDRPFIFLIRHEPTNTILFMGRVLDPRPAS